MAIFQCDISRFGKKEDELIRTICDQIFIQMEEFYSLVFEDQRKKTSSLAG
jgi:hypothetical protein